MFFSMSTRFGATTKLGRFKNVDGFVYIDLLLRIYSTSLPVSPNPKIAKFSAAAAAAAVVALFPTGHVLMKKFFFKCV